MIKVMYDDSPTTDQIMREYAEAVDIIPALHKYQSEHNSENLQKLCVEVLEFCNSIYASTRNDEERSTYNRIFAKIKR